MHELSVALSLIELVEEEALRLDGRVSAVHLRLGALAGVEKQALHASWELACAGTGLEGSRLVIVDVAVVVYCTQCAQVQALGIAHWFCCPECGAPTPDVRQGRELELAALEVT